MSDNDISASPKERMVDEKQSDSFHEEIEAKDQLVVIDVEAERRLVRKFDRLLLPLLMAVYLLGYLDRTNLGNARLQGLPHDILHGDASGKQYAWINSAFYFAYIFFQFPGTILGKYFKQNWWLGIAATGWGFCCAMQALAFDFGGIWICRFGIGVFESMFSPNMSLFFTFFYTRKEIGARLGIWFACASVAGAFGGLIAFGVQHIHSRVANWRLLFLIEGVPAFLIGFLVIRALPDRPESTKSITEEERALAITRMKRGGRPEKAQTLNKEHVKMAFKDWKIYAAGVIYFGVNTALSALGAFLPTIIASLGYSAARAQLFTVPPYAVGAAVLIMTNIISDRLQSRGIPMILISLCSGTGYLILVTVAENHTHVRYFATFLITAGTYTTIGLAIAWFPYNMGSESKRAAGIPIFQAIGQCGSILGSNLYPNGDGPRYIKGFAVSCALAYLTTIIATVLTCYARWENRRRDRLYGPVDPNAEVDTSEFADNSPNFRYTP